MCSDFKGRGFELEDSQLAHADRLERLVLIMALARYGCVRVGRDDAAKCPTPLEKKYRGRMIRTIGALRNSIAVWCLGSPVAYVVWIGACKTTSRCPPFVRA